MEKTQLPEDLNLIATYLARRDVPELNRFAIEEPANVLVLLGGSLIGPIRIAAQAVFEGCAARILVSGGIGHATPGLYDNVARHPVYFAVGTHERPEADIMSEILIEYLGVDPDLVLVENRSTNCGANALESRDLLDKKIGAIEKAILIQDPTMQFRTHKSFERAWADRPSVEFLSFAPFIPRVYEQDGEYFVEGDGDGLWPFERFVSLVAGEIERLRDAPTGYGPKGKNFIGHVEIPLEVLSAYDRVVANPGCSFHRRESGIRG